MCSGPAAPIVLKLYGIRFYHGSETDRNRFGGLKGAVQAPDDRLEAGMAAQRVEIAVHRVPLPLCQAGPVGLLQASDRLLVPAAERLDAADKVAPSPLDPSSA